MTKAPPSRRRSRESGYALLKWGYRCLFVFLALYNSLYLPFSVSEWHSYAKWPVILLQIPVLLLLGFFYQRGFAAGANLFFPVPQSFGPKLRLAAVAMIVAAALVLCRFVTPAILVAGLAIQFYGFALLFAVLRQTTLPLPGRSLRKGWAVFLLGLVLTLGLVEGMNRTFWFGIFRWEPQFGITLRPNRFYQINEQGFRGPLLSTEKRNDQDKRILFLGDSSTFGFDVPWDQTFAEQTAQCLSERGPARVEAINGGTPGYNLDQLLARGDFFSAYKPDLVVVMAGFHFRKIGRLKNDGGQLAKRVAAVERRLGWLDDLGLTFFAPAGLFYISHSIWKQREGANGQRDYELYRATLQAFADRYRSRNLPVCFLVYPSPKIDPQIQTTVVGFAADHDPFVLDLRDRFEQDPDGLLTADRIHPNRAGHRVIAQALCERLSQEPNLWISRPPAIQ